MRERLLKLIYAAVMIGFLWLILRFLLPWTAPILVAFTMAALLENAVRPMVRGGWHRKSASAAMTAVLLGALISLITAAASRAMSLASDFAGEVPELMGAGLELIRSLRAEAEKLTAASPEGLKIYLSAAADGIERLAFTLPAELSQKAMAAVGSMVQSLPDVLLFTVTAGIGTYFISASYPQVTAFVLNQLPADMRRRFSELSTDLKGSFGGFLRAQLILMLITFFELLTAFLIFGIDGAFYIAAVTALVDALPVFGVGTVLLPWAAFELLMGEYGFALRLTVLWGGVNIVRSCIQAKLLGDQIGLDPVVSLLAVYIGWRVCGVMGMLTFPLIFVTVVQLNDRGIIRLWKN